MQLIVIVMSNWVVIALLAIAFQLIYLPTRVFFLALGGVYSAAPYLMLMAGANADPLAAGIASIFVGALVTYLVDRWNHRPLTHAKASAGTHLIASLGVYILIVECLAIVFGNEVRVLMGAENLIIDHEILKLRASEGVIFVAGGLAVLLYLGVLRWTTIGLRVRALADDPRQFELFGLAPEKVRGSVVAVAGGLTALSAVIAAYDRGFDPHGGLHVLLVAIVAVIIGGRRSFLGPLAGALVVAGIRETTAWTLSAHWTEFATFLTLCIFLVLMPQGIVSVPSRLESETR